MNTVQRPSISTLSQEMMGAMVVASTGAVAFPNANEAIFVPLVLSRPIFVKRLFCANGNVTNANIDMGIYTPDGGRIASVGSTAQLGVTTLQFFPAINKYLNPGNYYLAVVKNDTTGTLRRFNTNAARLEHFGVLKSTSSFPLPANVTFVPFTTTYLPNIGLELVGLL